MSGKMEETYTTQAIILVIIFWLLDHIPSNDGLVAMVIVLLVGDEVGLSQELLLVILEFSDHDVRALRAGSSVKLISKWHVGFVNSASRRKM